MTSFIGHICNKGNHVLFRDEKDYVCINNKIATASFQTRIQILAFSIMSTHVHIVVKSNDRKRVAEFMSMLKKAYGIYYSRKYAPLKLEDFSLMLYSATSEEDIINKIVYVCRNPVHHYICSFPFAYRFSSAKYYFWDEIHGDGGQLLRRDLRPISDLSVTKIRTLLRSGDIPRHWLVDTDMMISPLSFVEIRIVRDLWWNKLNSFLYNMIKNVKDSADRNISDDILEIRSYLSNDATVCKIIDDTITSSYGGCVHTIDKHKKNELSMMLSRSGYSAEQIRRCLWTDVGVE